MIRKEDEEEIVREFRKRQGRQLLAIATTLVLLLFLVLVHKRHDLFGEISKHAIFAAQTASIAAFIVFSAINWRCPLCNRYLGSNIHKRVCGRCGSKLQ